MNKKNKYLVIINYGILGFSKIGECNSIEKARKIKMKYKGSSIVLADNIWTEIN